MSAATVTDFTHLVQPEQAPPHLRDQLLTVAQLADLPPVDPLIDGLLYRGTIAQLSGAPGSYKSFLAVAWAVSVALSEPFEGHAVPHAGVVVYAAPEGASGLRARILAYCELNELDPNDLNEQLLVLPAVVPLDRHVEEAIDVITERDAALLILDTRARCTAGLEENSATEQGQAITRAEQIASTGCATLAVHHSSRAGTGAGRGSNAWDGAVWSDLRITGEHLTADLTCHKHKDVPAGCEHHYRLVPHTVSEHLMPNRTQAQRSTLVITQADGHARSAGEAPSTHARKAIQDLADNERAYRAVTTVIAGGKVANVSNIRAHSGMSNTRVSDALTRISTGANRWLDEADAPRHSKNYTPTGSHDQIVD